VPAELLVLAGGFGTRLRAAIADVPKPLAPVGNRPFLDYLIENWLSQGLTALTFLLHYESDSVKLFLEQAKRNGQLRDCDVYTSTEPQPMGTGGAVAYAVRERRLTGSFLVTNADTWLGGGIQQVLNAPAPAIAIVKVENSERYGSVQIDDFSVAAFKEKQNSSGPGWINAGLYNLHSELFESWDGRPFSLERGLFPRLAETHSLRAVPLNEEFIDIGIPEDYRRFCRWVETKKSGNL
jgi:D-glycero-alpha-D-manno-heptose 1-phosphate guanylyltransferase